METIKNINVLIDGKYKAYDVTFDKCFKEIKEVNGISNLKLIPGLVDIHTHGGNGYDFNNAKTKEEMIHILKFYESNGITTVFPTLLTDSKENLKEKIEMIYELSKTYPIIKGIHMEGPFLSKEFKGAQNELYLAPLDTKILQEYIDISHGLIKYMTISPELENASEFIKYAINHDIIVSLGHSGATFDEASAGVKAGATSFTHVMNAMKGIHQHYPSILGAAWYYDTCYNEVIMDGIHVNKEVVKLIYKIKGEEKVIGITDSLMAAGLKDGEYFIGDVPIIVENHDCKLKENGVRAGSTLRAIDGFKNAKSFLDIDDAKAIKIWSSNALKLQKLYDLTGKIEKGCKADFIILDNNDELLATFINGKCVYKKEVK